MEPIFLRGSVRTAPRLPEFVRESRDLIMPECDDAVSHRAMAMRRSVRRVLVRGVPVRRVLQRLPRTLGSHQVILVFVLLGDTVRVRRSIVQFGGALVILVMRCVVSASGHVKESRSAQIWYGLPWQVC